MSTPLVRQSVTVRRGGQRPGESIRASKSPVVADGRWGRRRVRVTECCATFRAEAAYDKFLREGVPLNPAWVRSAEVKVPIKDSAEFSRWRVQVEIRANSIWRPAA